MNAKKLGFGLMRLPLLDASDSTKIDYKAVSAMADRYLQAGFTYFDTATPYHGGGHSETAFRECVARRYERSAYTITDKLSLYLVQKAEDLEGFFAGQLTRCGVDYFDYYLLHAMNRDALRQAEAFGAFDFVARKKAEGKIRHAGFSFHDKADVLDEILTRHPEMEYVQLQINYADWENPDVQARLCYETARRHGKEVLVMEPVKGGLLVNLPQEAQALLQAAAPERSLASWAVRFAASLPGVAMVLSGMSSLEQMEDNLSYMADFQPLTEEEKRLLEQVTAILLSKETIACTNCRYCVDGCPQKIGIPDYFKLINDIGKYGAAQQPRSRQTYSYYTGQLGMGKASACIGCRQCEARCPQHLPITTYLRDVAAQLE